MSHELTEKDTMFSHRVLPWHGLGIVVEDAPTSEVAIELAGLDYVVEKVPVVARTMVPDGTRVDASGEVQMVEIPRYHPIEGGYATLIPGDEPHVLGIVGEQYTVVQNHEAFAFLDSLVSDGVVRYETAGSLKDRRHIFICAKLPEGTKVAGEDIDIYVVASNFHDGTGALRVDVTPVRVVCKNTQLAAFGSAKRTWRLRHTTGISDRLEEARKTLELTRNFEEEFVEMMERLALQDISREATIHHLNEVWKPKDEQEVSDVGAGILTNLELSPTIPDDMRATAYGVFNAATEYLDWKQQYRETSTPKHEARWTRIDRNAASKGKLLELLSS